MKKVKYFYISEKRLKAFLQIIMDRENQPHQFVGENIEDIIKKFFVEKDYEERSTL